MKGKGKGICPSGKQACYSWGRCRDGKCKDLGLKTECPDKREHLCEFCFKDEHKSKDCPNKPDGATF